MARTSSVCNCNIDAEAEAYLSLCHNRAGGGGITDTVKMK